MSKARGAVRRDVWDVLFAVEREIDRAAELHGRQTELADIPPWAFPGDLGTYNLPDVDTAKERCQESHRLGFDNWAEILIEEVCEALAEAGADEDNLQTELIQVAAVASAWARAINERTGASVATGRSDEID